MSRASKIFLGSSIVLSGLTVWGVHFLQQRESDTMYQGVLKDEARLREKAAAAAATLAQGVTSIASSSSSPSSASSSSIPHSSHTPLNTPSSPVQQPAAVTDADCETCRISPPPQLVEAQSRDQRRAERLAREQEYEAQKRLAGQLQREQGTGGIGARPSTERLV